MSKLGDDRAELGPEPIDWKRTYEQLVAYGRRRHHLALEDAKQVAQEAIRRFFDPSYLRYDPELHGTSMQCDLRATAKFDFDRDRAREVEAKARVDVRHSNGRRSRRPPERVW